MNLLSKLTYAVAGMALSTALLAGTPVTFAQEDAPTVNQRTTGSRNASAAVETAADVLGITVEALQDYYADGFSLSDVIADLGLDEDTVRTELRAAIQADKLAAQAELLGISEADLQARLDAGETFREIAEDLGVDLPEREGNTTRTPSAAVETAADVLGITVEDLQDYYADGLSLSDVIADLGLDEDTVRAELRTAVQADKLGISAAELQTRLDAGETLREIAADLGVELQQRGRRSGRNNR